jgi:outer membrane lipoprotein carrier protein
MLRIFVSLLAVALCSFSSVAGAVDGDQVLRDFISSTESWQANFDQQLMDEEGNVLETASGIFSLLRPNRFRWEYQMPWEQQIVADGERIWLYDVDLEQVTVRDMQGSLGSTPAALLAGDVSALNDYELVEQREDAGAVHLTLVPLDKSGDFDSVMLSFVAGELAGLELRDKLGQTTQIRFSKINATPDFNATDFAFVAPETVDVIDESAL